MSFKIERLSIPQPIKPIEGDFLSIVISLAVLKMSMFHSSWKFFRIWPRLRGRYAMEIAFFKTDGLKC